MGEFNEKQPTNKRQCPDDKPVVCEIKCLHGYCGTMNINCCKLKTGYKANPADTKTVDVALSDEWKYCPDGYYVGGIGCYGSRRCAKIELRCVKVDWLSYHEACSPISENSRPVKGVEYSQDKTYNENVYPLGTEVTFNCPYNPFRYYDHAHSKTTCQAETGWDKDPASICANINIRIEKGFRLLPNSFNKCPSSMYLSRQDCATAGQAVKAHLQDGNLLEGSAWVPPGCSINSASGNGYIIFNSDTGENDGHYKPICRKGKFMLLPSSYKGACPSSMEISKEDCAAVGISVEGTLEGSGDLSEVDRHDIPYGCSLGSDGTITYNDNQNGKNNKKEYTSICHEVSVSDFRNFCNFFE